MKKLLLTAALLSLPSILTAQTGVERLRDAALKDDIAYDIVEDLTTEVGPRLAGTPAEARARQWAVAKLRSLGFSNVHIEDYQMPVWVRGEEKAEIIAPFPQPLVITALGNSGATPAGGITAEVVGFDSVAELEAAPDAAVRGKIVFVTHQMMPTQDGLHYGQFGAPRRQGPTIASRKGAAAIVIRSIGTDYHRNPHTGVQSFAEGVKSIPAGALSIPDAEQLERILDRAGNRPVTMRLTMTPRQIGMQPSGNVVAEVPGTDPNAGIVLIGGHIDSWDLGTGAIDNAAGVAITTAAAKRIMDAGRPRRTIRVVLFGAEEVGLFGSNAYYERHKDENVVMVAESDFGADRIWRMQTRFAEPARSVGVRVADALAPLGIAIAPGDAGGGADLSIWVRNGRAAIDLNQDGTRYFDYHHTPDDTLDKIDPEQLRQNVAAWTAMLGIVANAPEEIGRVAAAAQ